MRHRFQRHPFAVAAHFDWTLVLTYAFPSERLRSLLPPGLALDEWEGRGFVAIALVQTRGLRPAGWPEWTGQNFFLTGYRVFTRYRTHAGRTLRGLRILRSDTDQRRMVWAGNLLTRYGYRLARVTTARDGDGQQLALTVRTPGGEADLAVRADLRSDATRLPAGSPFPDWRQARRFAGPLPFTFDHERETNAVIRVEGVRSAWHPRPVAVEVATASFVAGAPFTAAWWPARLLLVLGALAAGASLLVSLAVSWWVYDRSPLYRWDWLRTMAASEPAVVVNVHSGFDESSGALRALFPRAELIALDFYDPEEQTEPSIARARRAYPHPPVPARSARADALPLPDGAAELVLLSLAAHEVRSTAGREALFREVTRVLRPGGQAVLVEHGRDLANFLAFGPGFLHFFSPAEWRRVARTAGLTTHQETRITPFVHVWDLRRPI